MKNLLVEALRQASDGDEAQTLSDSGSFDTTQSDFPATANDPVAEQQGTAEELALFETSVSFAATFDSDTDDIPEDSELRQTQSLVVSTTATNAVSTAATSSWGAMTGRGPLLAQFTPHACILLALLAATSWFAAQHFKLNTGSVGLTASQHRDSGSQIVESTATENGGTDERFPFIAGTAASADAEGDE